MTDPRHHIPPYWTRFGSFFLYPLSGEPLLMCLGFGLLSGLASLFFTLAMAILQLLLTVGMLRYGYKVLERTARGHLKDDLVYFESAHGGKYLPYKQFVVIAVAAMLCLYVGSLLGPHPAIVLGVGFAVLLPANTMILASTNDLGESMSPPRLWALMRGIGAPYLGLCACLLLLTGGSDGLLRFLLPIIPRALVTVVVGAVSAYFIIIMFRLMGYALYQYHDVLDLRVDVGFERQETATNGAPADPARQRAENSAALLREGRFDEALALAREELVTRPDDLSANLRLHRLLLAIPDQETAMLEHATGWLPTLLGSRQERQAVEVIDNIWQHAPDYTPGNATQVKNLARACLDARRPDSTARLIKGFDRRFPGHPDIPAVYILGARLLIEHQRDEAQARRVLQAVREHYPEHPAAGEAVKLGELLDRLSGVGAAG